MLNVLHLPAKVNFLSVQTFMASKTLSDSDSENRLTGNVLSILL